MNIEPVAIFHSPMTEKFGIPRQAGLAPSLHGQVVLEPAFRSPDSLRGLDGFDYIWLIWGFSLNRPSGNGNLTVRPPRLGGNERVGVFASRSPYRPNPLGLSSVRIESIDASAGIIEVSGADLADGTPIYDIKPYVSYTDAHERARSGFVDSNSWKRLEVRIPDALKAELGDSLEAVTSVLSEDPRPQYQEDPDKVYGMDFGGRNIKFKVQGDALEVTAIE